ncbi:hypothetical protein [Peribacillus glennii]|nr:hypothetical protein [Peribacillus glennii]
MKTDYPEVRAQVLVSCDNTQTTKPKKTLIALPTAAYQSSTLCDKER